VALTAVFGGIVGFFISSFVEDIVIYILPFAAGGFIYIASSDLIPELHKETKLAKSLWQIFFFLLGIGLMVLLLKLN